MSTTMFEKELRRIADELHLQNWRFTVEVEELGEAWAKCIPTDFKEEATIVVDPDLLTSGWPVQREVIVHELLHCHHAGLTDFLDRTLSSLDLDDETKRIIAVGVSQQVELFVDRLAVAINKRL